eukprot:TRINITY_DN66265_c0_g1_i1.p1 TRINITY_DN66265_c0_g1~~TRINITY_DN66265_c0_g1_i1.p1  ORF type:complete len:396 (+),score=78.55 TRINITY_DN66265_c0_g1_i1:71-1189(+)
MTEADAWLCGLLRCVARSAGWDDKAVRAVADKLTLVGASDPTVLRELLQSPERLNARLRSRGQLGLKGSTAFAILSSMECTSFALRSVGPQSERPRLVLEYTSPSVPPAPGHEYQGGDGAEPEAAELLKTSKAPQKPPAQNTENVAPSECVVLYPPVRWDPVAHALANPADGPDVANTLPDALLKLSEMRDLVGGDGARIVGVPLSTLYFYQGSIACRFEEGRDLQETIDALRSGQTTICSIPLITVQLVCCTDRAPRLYSLNNRRLACFHHVFDGTFPDLIVPVLWDGSYTVRGFSGGLPQGNDTDVNIMGCAHIDGRLQTSFSLPGKGADVNVEELVDLWYKDIRPEQRTTSDKPWCPVDFMWPDNLSPF